MNQASQTSPNNATENTAAKRPVRERIVTALPNLYKTTPEDCSFVSLAEVAHKIKTDPQLEKRGAKVRALCEKHGRGSGEYKAAKKKLPAVIFAGKFSSADTDGFSEHSGLMVIDFDDLPREQVAKLLRSLSCDPHTALVMISPSRAGLKWLVAVEARDESTHKACFHTACDYAFRKFGVQPDKGGDISRKCLLAHDPGVEVREPTQSFAPNPLHLDTGGETVIVTAEDQTFRHSDIQTYIPEVALPVLSESDKPWVLKLWERYLPRSKNHTNDPIFDCGRVSRNVESKYKLKHGSLHRKDRGLLFDWWCGAVNPEFMTKSKADYRAEWLAACNNAKQPLGETPVAIAWELSRDLPPPPEAFELFPDEGAEHQHRIFSVAHLLSRAFEGGTILLPVNEIVELATAEGIQRLKNPNQVNRIIQAMQPHYLRKTRNFEFNISNPRESRGSEFVYLGHLFSDEELRDLHAARLRSLAA